MHAWMVVFVLAQAPVMLSPEAAARGRVNEAVTLARAGRLADALIALDASIVLDPFYAPAHHNRGVVLAMMGRDREALAALDRAVRLAPNEPSSRRVRTALLRRLSVRRVRGPSARG